MIVQNIVGRCLYDTKSECDRAINAMKVRGVSKKEAIFITSLLLGLFFVDIAVAAQTAAWICQLFG